MNLRALAGLIGRQFHPIPPAMAVAARLAAEDAPPAAAARAQGAKPAWRDWQPTQGLQRMYHAAANDRLTAGWGSSISSADTELQHSLTRLRSRSRALVRDAGYPKRAHNIVVNNVIGSGMGLQALVENTRSTPIERVNDQIEALWKRFSRAEFCHTGGRLHMCDMERMLMGQVFDAGEVFVRVHLRAEPGSPLPLALEVIEAERIADEYVSPDRNDGREIRQGIEVNEYGRPLAYYVRERHPGDLRSSAYATDRLIRVDARDMLHLAVVDRWPQTRGEPWMHAAARRLNDMDGYSEAEIVAARAAAAYVAFLKQELNDLDPADAAAVAETEEVVPGMMRKLPPGFDVVFNNPTRPNPAMDPFMRMMLREVAAATGVSYESLSRDYSRSNYSSSRLALLEDRDTWRALQLWWMRVFRLPLHRLFMRQAVLSGALPAVDMERYIANPEQYEAVAFKARGWSWIDPTKEVDAAQTSVRAGFTTVSDVIAQTNNGMDLEDTLKLRRRELDLMDEMGLTFDTDPSVSAPAPKPPAPEDKEEVDPDDDNAAGARVVNLRW